MPTSTINEATLELWLDNPIVKQAMLPLREDHSALDLLESLHGVLSTLDERFPGLSHRALFAASRDVPDSNEVYRELIRAGVSHEDAGLVCPLSRLPSLTELPETLCRLIASGAGWREIVAGGWAATRRSAFEITRIKQPLTSLEAALLADLKTGAPAKDVARRHGTSPNTVRTARRKDEYQRWLEREQISAGAA